MPVGAQYESASHSRKGSNGFVELSARSCLKSPETGPWRPSGDVVSHLWKTRRALNVTELGKDQPAFILTHRLLGKKVKHEAIH